MANEKMFVVLPTDGNQSGDAREWTGVPTQSVAGLGIKKDPTVGAWIALTAIANGSKLGYVTARSENNIRSEKVRFVLTDHPDGPA